MKEARLKELQGTSRLALGFFNSLIRRIECTKPLAGDGITITQADDGIVINASSNNVNINVPSGVVTFGLNVCSAGQISQIVVLGIG